MNIFNFLFKEKHTFDENNPIIDVITITKEYQNSGKKIVKKMVVSGYTCTKCGKVLWVDKEDLKNLSSEQKYCKFI
jgi:hypothetical protein